eukprot:CAMPEP_0113454980 /NCGR_PEP_ID=MMETSP0014_2-20120614/8142_1 /TAXON_ID=2857 /ORGANISM="Nitzschia sp." /LENGTH=1076 /DNA_ID=CAMNT_0000346401 /DNA_START=75 /DNA_END=3305 /DNA_ORIENTATION=- /assembly_acc=CAM_ASM_000159
MDQQQQQKRGQDGGGGGDTFIDHWSLGSESVTLRLRSKHLRILEDDRGADAQMVLIQDISNNSDGGGGADPATTTTTTTAQSVTTSNFGMRLLRTIYTLVAVFVMTVLFAFGAQSVLFLFMNLVAGEDSNSWTNPKFIQIFGAVLAVPMLLYSMASMMSLSWAFVVDCWNGMGSNESSLLRRMVHWSGTLTEWIVFVIMGGVPLVTLTVTTFMKDDDWWEVTTLVWVIACGFFQVFYMLLVFINEMHVCKYVVEQYGKSLLLKNSYDLPSNDDVEENGAKDEDAQNHRPTLDGQRPPKGCIGHWVSLIKLNILITQRQKYSGVRHERFVVNGKDSPPPEGFSASNDTKHRPVQYHWKKFSRWTTIGGSRNCCVATHGFKTLPVPRRNYTIDEVFGNTAILNNQNWSMERFWCMDRSRGSVITLRSGPSAVSKFELLSSHACLAVSSVLILLAVAGFLVWAGQKAVVVVLVLLVVFAFCFLPMAVSSFLSYKYDHKKVSKSLLPKIFGNKEDGDTNAERDEPVSNAGGSGADNTDVQGPAPPEPPLVPSAGATETTGTRRMSLMERNAIQHDDVGKDEMMISVWESLRVSEPTPTYCWMVFGLEITIFYLWPVISLFASGNGPVATLLFIVGLFSLCRHYFNATNILQSVGRLDSLPQDFWNDMGPALGGLGGGSKEWWSSSIRFRKSRQLRNQALIASLSQRATRSRATRNWMFMFGFLLFCVLVGFLLAANEEEFEYKVKGVVFPEGFYYEQQPQLPYPTCSVQKGFTFPGQDASALADYAFLATTAFAGPGEAQALLDNFFGPGVIVDDYEFVEGYRNATNTAEHPVTYSLYSFPSIPDSAIVAIRGSESMWDWMVDIQLWTGSVLAQIIRGVNPFGFWIWTPILDEMVWAINSVQSQKLKDVSYYRYTSRFVEDLYAGSYDGRQYDNLRVTGASLGGGLAILTGAITGASAIATSGLNAMFSRRTFEPPITKEQLDTRVFNTIPERDVIAAIDVPGQLFQEMQCRGPKNSIFGCHSMYRSLCEIQYQCGSNGRPINCWCTSKYGYPYPTQNGTKTWEEACGDAPQWTPGVAPV